MVLETALEEGLLQVAADGPRPSAVGSPAGGGTHLGRGGGPVINAEASACGALRGEMLVLTRSGGTYSSAEYEGWLA